MKKISPRVAMILTALASLMAVGGASKVVW